MPQRSSGYVVRKVMQMGVYIIRWWNWAVKDGGGNWGTILTRSKKKVNFSDRHDNYYSACRYTTKEDSSSLQSKNHPDLRNVGAPIMTKASYAVWERRLGEGDEDASYKKGKRKRWLSIFDVSQIAVEREIKTRLELVALASQQKREGKTDLVQLRKLLV